MNASFGIDHPLLATHDIDALRARLIALGFNMTAVGKHPWGTSTSLAMFNGCLIEIMGIYDDTLLDQVPAGDFRFGRHVYEHLQQREGVALSALHSTGSVVDAAQAQHAGFTVAGHLEFGRDVTLPDGSTGRTKTTLALMPDAEFPRLSLFLCQQHRPELIYVPEWLQHPNQVTGICGVTILAPDDTHDALRTRFSGLYGEADGLQGGFQFQTANGVLRVLNDGGFETQIGPVPDALHDERAPSIAAMDLAMADPARMHRFLQQSGLAFTPCDGGYALTQAEQTANTTLRFLSA